MDFSKPNFVTTIPNFRSSKGPNKKCFLVRELQMRKLFHWYYVFTLTWYLEQEPKWALPKILARCAEIMRRDEISDLTVLIPGFLASYWSAKFGTFLQVSALASHWQEDCANFPPKPEVNDQRQPLLV
jgi:hypothetical protein